MGTRTNTPAADAAIALTDGLRLVCPVKKHGAFPVRLLEDGSIDGGTGAGYHGWCRPFGVAYPQIGRAAGAIIIGTADAPVVFAGSPVVTPRSKR